MRVFGLIGQFQHRFPDVTRSANEQERLRGMTLGPETRDAGLVCRTFGLSRATRYRWAQRLEPRDPTSLREPSRRPPSWPRAQREAVQRVREQYPRWGKTKLAVVLQRQELGLSASTVGRMLGYLKARGRLMEPVGRAIAARKRRPPRPSATRKPATSQPCAPGDLVQVDPLDLRPLPSVGLKPFPAREVISRWDVREVHERAPARLAPQFLGTLQARLPFVLRAIQVDGGAECFADCETGGQQRGIRLLALPPRSPNRHGAVERAPRTPTEEFYEVTPCAWTVDALNAELRQWEHPDHTIRPHQALGYRTPVQSLQDHGIIPGTCPSLSHMEWTSTTG
jgi:transposase InsO family protein